MSNPGQFKDFTKAANDLLTKVFPKKVGENSWIFEFALKPTSYFNVNAKIENKGASTSGEISDTIKFDDMGVELNTKVKTAGPTLELSLAVADKIPVDGLSAKLHFDAVGGDKSAQTAGVSLAFKHEYVTLNGRVFLPVTKSVFDWVDEAALTDQDTRLDVDFVTSHPDYKFYLGGLTKVSFALQRPGGERNIDESQVAVGWRDANLNGSANYTTTSKDGKDSQNVTLQVISKPGETTYVGQVGYDVNDKAATVTLGASYPLNDGAVVKVKADSNKQFGFSYSNKLPQGALISMGTLLAVDNSGDSVSLDSAFSFNLKFTD